MMEINDAIQRVVGNPGEVPELWQKAMEHLGGDSQKIGIALHAFRMAAEGIRILATLGVGMELRSTVVEPEVLPEPVKIVPKFDHPVGKRHK
ncbi:MAG TPA: hypothetical protein VJQ25_05925 [Nitrospira sp.]|nr:hypothetical protein [Nitrospira sp.]